MNPYAPPQQQSSQSGPYYPGGPAPFWARIDGANIVLAKMAFLPSVCVKCAAREPTPIGRKRKNYVFIPWYGRMFGLLGMLLTQKKATLDLPICQACAARHTQTVLITWLVTGGIVVLAALAAIGGIAGEVPALIFVFLFLMLMAFVVPITLFLAWGRARMHPQAVHIDDHSITLTRVHPGAMEAAMTMMNTAAQYGAPQYPQQPYPQQPYPPYPPR